MVGRFLGRTVIITGGGSGIGRAAALIFANEGAKVVVADISDSGAEVCSEMKSRGAECLFVKTNVAIEQEVEKLVGVTLDRFQRLDVMIANAGVGGVGRADELKMPDWQRVLDINLSSVMMSIKYAVPAMRHSDGGSIVCTASVMGSLAPKGAVAYAATKGGVINLVRAAAIDYASEHIRVNSVSPGHLELPTSQGGAQARALDKRNLVARYPMARLGKPTEVAEAIAFLASDAASFITGANLVVDGGFSAQ